MNNTLIIDVDVKYKRKNTSFPESRFSFSDVMFFKDKTNTSWLSTGAQTFVSSFKTRLWLLHLWVYSGFRSLPFRMNPEKVLTAESLFHAPSPSAATSTNV